MSTDTASQSGQDQAVVTCTVDDWSVTILPDGDCKIHDSAGRQVHHSNCHESTAIHFAVAMQRRREIRAELERRIEAHDSAAKPWANGSARQRRQMEFDNASPYVAWKAARELRELLSKI